MRAASYSSGGDHLERRQQEHRGQRPLLPHVGDDETDAGADDVAHPRHVAVDGAGGQEQAVQHPVVAVEDPAPEDPADDGRDGPREQDHDLQQRAAEHRLVQEQRGPQAVEGDGEHGQDGEDRGGPQGPPEVVAGDHLPEVLEADEVVVERPRQDVLVDAQVDAVEQRVDGEERHHRHDGQDRDVRIRAGQGGRPGPRRGGARRHEVPVGPATWSVTWPWP